MYDLNFFNCRPTVTGDDEGEDGKDGDDGVGVDDHGPE